MIFFYIGCIKQVVQKQRVHQSNASTKVIYRFTMLPKEIHNHATKMNLCKMAPDKDWSVILIMFIAHFGW